MPDTSDRVMAMVEKELAANPNISNDELRAKAERLDGSIVQLSARAFNARYPLQVKRRGKPRRRTAKKDGSKTRRSRGDTGRTARTAPARSRSAKARRRSPARPRAGGSEDARLHVRAALLDFARDLAAADGAAGIVDVVGSVDDYVERILAGT